MAFDKDTLKHKINNTKNKKENRMENNVHSMHSMSIQSIGLLSQILLNKKVNILTNYTERILLQFLPHLGW